MDARDSEPEGPRRAGGARADRRTRSLRSHLLLIVLVTFLPLLVFSAVLVSRVAREEKETFRHGATARMLALLTALDTELKRSIAALEGLAASDVLDGPGEHDFEAFRADAKRVLDSRPEWSNIHLAPPTGVQVLNVLRPPAMPLHRVVDSATFEASLNRRQPVVGNLFREARGEYVFSVRVPVLREGEVRYVLSALVDPGAIRELLASQGLPPDWVCVVLDGNERVVARTIAEKERIGSPGSDSLRAALAEQSSGWFRGTTLEGWPVYTPFHRSSFSGWSVALGIPQAAVEAPMRRSLSYIGTAGAILMAFSVVAAWFLTRHAAASLERLSDQARDLGLGREPSPSAPLARTGIAEIERLQEVLARADGLIRARSDERDRVVASLRRAEAELRQSELRKDHFLAMLGHELRNPLGVIGNSVHLLRELPPEAGEEPRRMIERQVSHMAKLIDDLLDLSRISQGRLQISLDFCDLVEVVRETAEDYRGTLAGSGLELVVRAPEVPLWMRADRVRLAQALANLLQNADKYSDPGGRVSVTVAEDPGGESATVEVTDTGVGMEPEILEHAFEPFSQADRTIARSRGGLGLGLPLVKGLVEAHGGSVHVASEGAGRGTRVVMQLPLEPGLELVTAARPAGDEPSRDARPWRILVIEDNEMAARSIQLYLESQGHTVRAAHSGSAGLELAASFRPEVVLSDLGLPGIDGYEVARLLSADPRARPYLLAVSGYGQDADRRRAREAGFDDHLTKPLDLDALRRTLEALRHRRPGAPRGARR